MSASEAGHALHRGVCQDDWTYQIRRRRAPGSCISTCVCTRVERTMLNDSPAMERIVSIVKVDVTRVDHDRGTHRDDDDGHAVDPRE